MVFYSTTLYPANNFDNRVGIATTCSLRQILLDQTEIRAARNEWLGDPARLHRFKSENSLNDGPLILFVSRLHPQNRLDLLIEATALLVNRYPSLTVAIVGSGDEERQRLTGIVRSHSLEERFRFLGPIYEEMALAPWFLSSTLFCYPDHIGLSCLHSFGYGVPVVTSKNLDAQNPEVHAIVDGCNGRLYETGDVDSLIGAIVEIIETSNSHPWRENALRTVENDFNTSKMVAGFANAINFVMGKST